jgi:hypothetical protein
MLQRFDPATENPLDFGFVDIGGAGNERKVSQVPRQTDSAADDDVGLGSRTTQPFTTGFGKLLEIHGRDAQCK